MDIAKYNSPLNTTGGILGGFRVLNLGKLPNEWADWHQIRCMSVDSSGNGPRLNIQNTEKCGQTAGPIGNKFCTYNADESGNGHRMNKIGPMRHQGEHFDLGLSRGNFWGFRGVNISSKVWGLP